MSIQETLNEAKKELTSDEQMLASAFKVEKLYKKHKLKLFAIIAIALIYFGGTAIMDSIKEQKLIAANSAYLALSKDANNSTALTELKNNNPKLFELYTYQTAMENSDVKTLKALSSSDNSIIADMATYHLAILEGQPTNSELYSGPSAVNDAYILIKEGKLTQAKEKLDAIPEDSPVYSIAQMIKHYTIKGQ